MITINIGNRWIISGKYSSLHLKYDNIWKCFPAYLAATDVQSVGKGDMSQNNPHIDAVILIS